MIEQVMDLRVDEATDLTTTERAELGRYEAVIKRGLETFVAVGNALLAIRRDRLYRATHATFEAYCQQRWQMTPDYANKLIGAAEVVGNLNTIVSVLPTTESQARPLTRLGPEQQVEAWSSAVDDAQGKVPTAAQVTKAAAEFAPPKPAKAKVEPAKFATVWELNGKVAEWLEKEIGELGTPSASTVLDMVKIQSKEPRVDGNWLDLLSQFIVKSGMGFLRHELAQAINNVADQRRQAANQAKARAVYVEPMAEPVMQAVREANKQVAAPDANTPPDLVEVGYRISRWNETGKWVWSRPEGFNSRVMSLPFKSVELAVAAARDEIEKRKPKTPPLTKVEIINRDLDAYEAEAAREVAEWRAGPVVEMEPEPAATMLLETPAIVPTDPRLGLAQLLRYMLVQVRDRARSDYGELTGRHSDLLAWERDTELLIEPLDSLIEILTEKGQSK